jgi:hypothetical protein
MYLEPRNSLRKIFGIYELQLNGWLRDKLSLVDTVIDVGANDGYFTFGSAAPLRRSGVKAKIIGFEPDAEMFKQLESNISIQPKDNVEFALYNCFVGNEPEGKSISLDAFASRNADILNGRKVLIKIDVEGAEIEVINGAKLWMKPGNHFLIEVHHHSFLALLCEEFACHGMKLVQIDQQKVPILGPETRGANWWLVTE